jgi:hypothetical protein
MPTDADDSGTKSPQFPPNGARASNGFRRVPNWIFFETIKARREQETPLSIMEAWCSLDYDLFHKRELASERAYAANWRRSREWTAHVMRWFRAERHLPGPPRGRRPSRPEPPPSPNLPGHFAGQFLDQAVDRVSRACSAPWERSSIREVDHSTDHSDAASKKQRL